MNQPAEADETVRAVVVAVIMKVARIRRGETGGSDLLTREGGERKKGGRKRKGRRRRRRGSRRR
jgi:hypothetical protein